jgi:hypothetical protein
VLEVLRTLCNQAEIAFQYDNNIPTNQQIKQELDPNKISLCSYLFALGSLGCDKQV